MNKIPCVECMAFKTRVIANEEKFIDDEFRFSMKIRNFLKKKKAPCRIYYCKYERRPFLESKSINSRVNPECELVDTE